MRQLNLPSVLNANYIANSAVLISFWLVRRNFREHGDLSHSQYSTLEEMDQWESHTVKVVLSVCLIKLVRRSSLHSLMSDLLWYAKVLVLGLVYMIDPRVAACFLGLMLLINLAFPEPTYSGPDLIQELNPSSLRALVEGPGAEEGLPWLVEFYSTWSQGHVHVAPVLAKLSLEYGSTPGTGARPAGGSNSNSSGDNGGNSGGNTGGGGGPGGVVRFGRLDVGQWPAAAKDYSLPERCLPVLVLFEGGREVARLPDLKEDTWLPIPKIQRENIVHAFDLEQRSAGPVSGGRNTSTEPVPRQKGARQRK